MSTISVIIPIYKAEFYLHRCVDSILRQTFTDFELILVDDGSPDGCPAICDEYARKDSRIHVIHQENMGVSAARNCGIDWVFANSVSQWITFVDSDDWVHPEMLERLLNAALEYGLSINVCRYQKTEGEEPEVNTEKLAPGLWSTEDFFVEYHVNAIVPHGKLYRKDCFKEIRYPIGKIHEDEFITYRILFKYDQITFIDTPLYYYFNNPNGITGSAWTMERMASYDALEEQISFFAVNGFKLAHRASIRHYLCSVTDRICVLSADYQKYNDVLRELKHRKRKNFCRYAKMLDINDDRDVWVLTKVFPKRMWIFSHMKAVIQNIKKMTGHDK